MDIEFEFNQDKSQANKDKHGIDFVAAQALWKNTILQLRTPYPEEER